MEGTGKAVVTRKGHTVRRVYTFQAGLHRMSSGSLGLGITAGAVNFLFGPMKTERDPANQ